MHGKTGTRWVLVSLVTLLLTMASVASLGGTIHQSTALSSGPEEGIRVVSGTPHGPITINGDSNFNSTASAEGWAGNGTGGNPFIIENLEIDRGGVLGDCISISNTQVHFIVRNCILTGATIGAGIYLFNVSNGTLINNTITGNSYGVYLLESSTNIGVNNNCTDNSMAILVEMSDSITLVNNTANINTRGISIDMSSAIIIINNTCNGNIEGIDLFSSSSNIVANNTCNGNTIGIWVDGAGSNTVSNNTCIGNSDGIQIQGSISNTVTNNTCISSNVGIYIEGDSNSVINNICNDNEEGIRLYFANFNNVTDNICSSNNAYGIYLDASTSNTIANNTCSSNGNGITISFSDSNNVTSNLCRSNRWDGINLDSSTSNIIANNNSTGSGHNGIYLRWSDSNFLVNNTCRGASQHDIFIDSSSFNTVENNTCSNSNYGVLLTNANNNTMINNTCTSNTYGIHATMANNNNLTQNTFSGNDNGIVLFSDTANNYIRWNVFAYNSPLNGYDNAISNVFDHNYWSDYGGPDANQDGIGDIPYTFLSNVDLYPLMLPPGSSPSWLQLPANRLLELGDDFLYDLNATAPPPGLDTWWLNDTVNFDIDQIGRITNNTVLFLGVFGLQVFVNDTLGNTLSEVFSLTVIDTTRPEWIEPPRNQTIEVGESFVIKLNATDFLLDTWWLNDTVHFAVDADGVVSTAGIMPPGAYGIQVWVNDTSGNTLNGTFTVTVVDTTSPVWTEVPEDQIVEYGNDFFFDLNATDLLLDSWWVNDTAHFTVDEGGLMMAIDILQVGTYGVQVWVSDTSNNIISTTFIVTVVDTKPPMWSEQPKNQTLVYGTRFVCDFNATDLSGIAEWWVDDTVHFTIDWTGRVRTIGLLEPGIYGLRVYVNDIYGNTIWDAILVEVIPTITTTTTTTSNSAIVPTEHLDPLMTFIVGMGVGAIVIVVMLWVGLRRRESR